MFLSFTSSELRVMETNYATVTVKINFSAWLFSTDCLLNFAADIINDFPKLPRIKWQTVLVLRAPLLQNNIYKHQV